MGPEGASPLRKGGEGNSGKREQLVQRQEERESKGRLGHPGRKLDNGGGGVRRGEFRGRLKGEAGIRPQRA